MYFEVAFFVVSAGHALLLAAGEVLCTDAGGRAALLATLSVHVLTAAAREDNGHLCAGAICNTRRTDETSSQSVRAACARSKLLAV